jgi:hypothetical protein
MSKPGGRRHCDGLIITARAVSCYILSTLIPLYVPAFPGAPLQFVDGDVEWNARSTVIYPVLCIFAGFFAGLFGVGGGIIKGPLMLEMGVLPPVAAANAATMILFTTGIAALTFLLFGAIDPPVRKKNRRNQRLRVAARVECASKADVIFLRNHSSIHSFIHSFVQIACLQTKREKFPWQFD